MKQLTFSDDQKILLCELLNQRLEYYNKLIHVNNFDKAGKKRFETFFVNPLISALDNLSSINSVIYSRKEKLVFISCVNEHYKDFLNQLNLTNASSWLIISEEKRKLIAKIDDCIDILESCGYYNKKDLLGKCDKTFRYGNFLKAADKLKMSDSVFLSKVGVNDFYKIAFVYEEIEYVSFELKQKVSWKDFSFKSLNGLSPNTFRKQRFNLLTTKPEAKKLLATCEKQNYPEGVLEFMEILLN